MNRLKLVILLIFAFSIKLGAQNVVHLCIGDNHNFGVPDNPTSYFDWSVSDPSLAAINSGNGTHHILIDLNNNGVFQLLVEEIDANGCSGYDSIFIEIHALPMPNITAIGPISFCEGDSVLLQLDSIYAANTWNNGSIASSIWVDTTGQYAVEVTDTLGCQNISQTIFTTMHPDPDVSFSVDGVCEDMPTFFSDLSTIVSDNISDRIWYFGDGKNDNGITVTHYYDNQGTYISKLVVISDFGCLDSLSKLITIYEHPNASFTYHPFTISTFQDEMSFTNTSINTLSVLWSFDDSTFSTLDNPTHIFEDPGTYDVWLTVGDSNQCLDSIKHTIIMYYDFILYVPNSFTPDKNGINEQYNSLYTCF